MRLFMQTVPAGDEGPRYCQLLLHRDLFGGWTVIRESGRQGGGRPYVRRRHTTDHDEAVEIFMAWRDQQIGKGLRVVFFEGEMPEGR